MEPQIFQQKNTVAPEPVKHSNRFRRLTRPPRRSVPSPARRGRGSREGRGVFESGDVVNPLDLLTSEKNRKLHQFFVCRSTFLFLMIHLMFLLSHIHLKVIHDSHISQEQTYISHVIQMIRNWTEHGVKTSSGPSAPLNEPSRNHVEGRGWSPIEACSSGRSMMLYFPEMNWHYIIQTVENKNKNKQTKN